MTGRETAESARALDEIRAVLRDAVSKRQPVSIEGGGTKAWLRPAARGQLLSMSTYRDIVDYAPAELVVVVRAGTPLSTLQATLSAEGQQLAFEPPNTGPASTIGGVIGAGLSGPARPYTAAVRDHVLGVKLLGADGDVLRFGGQVMKNVAGYDVSRLVVGAWGALGPVIEVALRVVPCPALERVLCCPLPPDEVQAWVTRKMSRNWPVTGLCHDGERLHLRLAGSVAGVDAACAALDSGFTEDAGDFWARLRDLQLPFFADPRPLWRIVVPPATPALRIAGLTLLDWGGAQRWLKSAAPPDEIAAQVAAVGGNVWRFDERFARRRQDLSPARRVLEARIRQSFDPDGLFNPELDIAEE